MKYKEFISLVIFSFLLFYLLPIGCLLVVDPLQIFHKPWVRENYFIRELRFQAAGIINNSEFDSIILGASTSANFSPAEASRIWKKKFVNLSPDGATLLDRSIILDYALRKKDIKNVVISIDSFDDPGKRNSDFSWNDYSYLYNNNFVDDIQVYLNRKYMRYLFCRNILFSSKYACRGTETLETLAGWASDENYSKRFGGLEKWLEARNDGQIKSAFKVITEKAGDVERGDVHKLSSEDYAKRLRYAQSNFEKNVLRFVTGFPDTNFYLFFPPYSRVKYALWKQSDPDTFELYLKTVQYVVAQAEKYKNVNVFGFDNLDFPDDIANYKDPSHFHPRINSKILRWMKIGEHKLHNQNMAQYINEVSKLADEYDVVSIGKKINDYLKGVQVLNEKQP